MSDLTVSTDIDALLASANNAAARTSLGLGDAAEHAASDFDVAGAAASALTAAEAYTDAAILVIEPTIPVLDTGWTANGDTGDKTKAIPNATSVFSAFTPFDAVSFGSADILIAMAEKIKALETALAGKLLPNA